MTELKSKGDFSEKYSGNLDKMHYYDPNTGARVRKEGLVQDKEGRTFLSIMTVLNIQELV